MRVLILGGTRFIGRAITEGLVHAGHEVAVAHRGQSTPNPWVDVEHLFGDRQAFPSMRDRFAAFGPDAVIDTRALTRADAEAAIAALPSSDLPMVVLSSMDVYAAYGDLMDGRATRGVPLDECSPVRTTRYPYRGTREGFEDYEKLDVEEVYLAAGGTVCRLPMVFGPHDQQRREEFLLGRVRAGRDRVPFGVGNWLWTRLHVEDAAAGIRAMVEHGDVAGEVFNLGSRATLTIRQWSEAILAAAGGVAELVTVDDAVVPDDLAISRAAGQHLLADSSKARTMLGWDEADQMARIATSVAWHLAHPPEDGRTDFTEDDTALA